MSGYLNAHLEAIAEKVHDAWAAEKRKQGFARHTWCYGVECSKPESKHHPDMLPYPDLAENVKEYDRATVRAVWAAIEAAGLQIREGQP